MTIPGILLALQMSGQHDEELARRLQRRDPDAMADLYDRFGRIAYSVVVAIVRDPGVAEDLVQETFLRVWNRIQAFDRERGALGPWVLAVARNRAIDYLRSVDGRMQAGAVDLDRIEHPAQFSGIESRALAIDRVRRLKIAFPRRLTTRQIR